MLTDIPEINELTMRAYEQLPLVVLPDDSPEPYIRCEWAVLLDNPMFDGLYFGYVMAGDYGWYRLTDLGHDLVLRTSTDRPC